MNSQSSSIPSSFSPQELGRSRPILVTGGHRTGTTWVGKMLAAGGQAAYISEPLNVLHRPGLLNSSVKQWYTYICIENESEYLPAFQGALSYRYHLWAAIKSLRSRRDVLRIGRDAGIYITGRLRRQRPLLKDPFAVFSIPWFIDRLGCQVVVTVRHPAAFASSLKRLGWNFDFANLLAQPLLMRDLLESYRTEMEEVLKTPDDVIAQASLLWRIVYQTVASYRERFPGIHLASHEDFSLQPVDCYRDLYAALGLDFTRRAEKIILSSSSSENPKEAVKGAIHAVRLDSAANLNNWKHRLTPDEIERVCQLTAGAAAQYYPDEGWG
jgi:Sulfotransferase family